MFSPVIVTYDATFLDQEKKVHYSTTTTEKGSIQEQGNCSPSISNWEPLQFQQKGQIRSAGHG